MVSPELVKVLDGTVDLHCHSGQISDRAGHLGGVILPVGGGFGA